MGERSITKLTVNGETVRSYLHWGSPEFQIPAFADFVYWAWSSSRPWSMAAWNDFLAGVGKNHLPNEPAEGFHGDLNHYYRIVIGLDGSVDYAYRHRKIGDDLEWTDWTTEHQAHSRLELYRLAAAQLVERRRYIQSELRRRPNDEHIRGHLDWIDQYHAATRIWQKAERLPGAAQSPSLAAFHESHGCGSELCDAWKEVFQGHPTNWREPDVSGSL